jgi:hypothetical protein
MLRPCTPGEVARWRRQLRALRPERQDAVIRMLAEAVADCPTCEEPVRRCDPRRLGDSQLAHLRCTEEVRQAVTPLFDARALAEIREQEKVDAENLNADLERWAAEGNGA